MSNIDIMLQVLEEEILEDYEENSIILNKNDRNIIRSLLEQLHYISRLKYEISPTLDGEIVIEARQDNRMLFIYYLPNKQIHYVGLINDERISHITNTVFDENNTISDTTLLQIIKEMDI